MALLYYITNWHGLIPVPRRLDMTSFSIPYSPYMTLKIVVRGYEIILQDTTLSRCAYMAPTELSNKFLTSG